MQYVNICLVLNVEEFDCLFFMLYLFGMDFMFVELQVYVLVKKWMFGYEGGFWYFICLLEGGGYMMLDCGWVYLVSSENWFDCIVSVDVVGIILISLVINCCLVVYYDSSNLVLICFYMLCDVQFWNYIIFYFECSVIYVVLD